MGGMIGFPGFCHCWLAVLLDMWGSCSCWLYCWLGRWVGFGGAIFKVGCLQAPCSLHSRSLRVAVGVARGSD